MAVSIDNGIYLSSFIINAILNFISIINAILNLISIINIILNLDPFRVALGINNFIIFKTTFNPEACIASTKF
jgi:hypothetical protein